MPLVTVGVPTFNRPDGLRETLECLSGQTFRDLEIIISDNASTDPAVEAVARAAIERDTRIRFTRRAENAGPMANFNYLARQGNGHLFMWAADDDWWQPDFVECCVKKFLQRPNLAMVSMEAQYRRIDGRLYPFFREGRPFYSFTSTNLAERAKHTVTYSFGNMFYGLWRREALQQGADTVIRHVGATLNELPLLMAATALGDAAILPEIGWRKTAPPHVSAQARWEQSGGFMPGWPGLRQHLAHVRENRTYHDAVYRDVVAVLESLALSERDVADVARHAKKVLDVHQRAMTFRFKLPAFARASFAT